MTALAASVTELMDRVQSHAQEVQQAQATLDRYLADPRTIGPVVDLREAAHREYLAAHARLSRAERELDAVRDRLPYRPRVEVVAVWLSDDGEPMVLAGIHDNDGSIGFPAGGIEEGECPELAACRELLEETGYRALQVGELPMALYRTDWHPPFLSPSQRRRAVKYRGSVSKFMWVLLDGPEPVQPGSEPGAARDLRLRPVDEVLTTGDRAHAERPELFDARRYAARLAVPRAIVAQLVTSDVDGTVTVPA